MPTDLPSEPAADDRYAYKASLIGSAHQFELTDAGLSWQIAGRSGVWAYADISAIRLSYRPVSMQSRRFRADISHASGARLAVLSTTWQTVSLMKPQDHGYRTFIARLHRRMAAVGSKAALIGGLTPNLYLAALVSLVLLGIAMAGLLVRAIATGEYSGALFLLGFAALFTWQIGGFVRRNRPRTYTFDDLPAALLP
jgi:hypothetical protein